MLEFLAMAAGALLSNNTEAKRDRILDDLKEGNITRKEAINKLSKLTGEVEEFEGLTVPKDIKKLLENGHNADSIKDLPLDDRTKGRLMRALEVYEDLGNYDYEQAAENRKYGELVQLQGDAEAIKRILGK